MRLFLLATFLGVMACGRTTVLPPGEAASCFDGLQDADESDVDCGGSCSPCAAARACQRWSDCSSGSCVQGRCTARVATCIDGIQNGSEADVDCGGGCSLCEVGRRCGVDSDCISLNCDAGFCTDRPPSCTDGMRNGDESAVDCGGSCPHCGPGEACTGSDDCASGACVNGRCAAAQTCDDGLRNGAETDVDCGGDACARCPVDARCSAGSDCSSGACEDGVCVEQQPSCSDSIRNGDESDVDCGGQACPGCALGQHCGAASDCVSTTCSNGQCAPSPPTCSDGIQDGSETDVDCGGPTCAPCGAGRKCATGVDCRSSVCSAVFEWSRSVWKQSSTPGVGATWWLASYNDSSWSSAVEEAPYGQPPWGNGAPMPAGTPARWIWSFDSRTTDFPSTVCFRRTFTVPNTTSMTLSITADDEFDVYVDGVLIGTGNWWYTTRTFTLSATPGSSKLIAIEGRNAGGGLPGFGPAGLLVDLRGNGTWCR